MPASPSTAALDLAIEAAGEMGGGFPIADVLRVEATWSMVDADFASFGFIFRLADGTRRQVDLTFDEVIDQEEVDVELTDLDAGDALPNSEVTPWSTDVDHLNERLAELRRQ